MENCTGLFSPPLPRLCANKKLAFVLLTRQSWQKTDPSEWGTFLPPVPALGLGLEEKLRGGLVKDAPGVLGPTWINLGIAPDSEGVVDLRRANLIEGHHLWSQTELTP